MTFTIHLWHIMVVLLIFPIIYATFRKPSGDYDFQLDTFALLVVCWATDLGIFIGYFCK